jgi:hypothetical protein
VAHGLRIAPDISQPTQHAGGGKDDIKLLVNRIHDLHDIGLDELGVDVHLLRQHTCILQ